MNFFEKKRYSEAYSKFDSQYGGSDGVGHALTTVNQATCQFQLELYRKCVNSCNVILKEQPSNIRALILLAKALRELQHVSEAQRAFDDALQACHVAEDAFMMLVVQECMTSSSKNTHSSSIFNTKAAGEPSVILQRPVPPSQPLSCTAVAVTSLADIEGLRKRFVGVGQGQFDPTVLQQARCNLSHATGIEILDDMIAFGYLQVNVGNLDVACFVFKKLLSCKSNILGAHLGLGSALALKGRFDEAIASFSNAIIVDATISDAWKRRGQTKMAKGCYQDALIDFTRSIDLGGDADAFAQRGSVYYKMKNFKKALGDLQTAHSKGETTADLYNQIGMTTSQLGNTSESIQAYEKAIMTDPGFIDAYINLARIYKEVGNTADALICLNRALSLEKRECQFHAITCRGSVYYAEGRIPSAISDYKQAATLKGEDESVALNMGIFHFAIGKFSLANKYFQQAITINKDSIAWYHSQVMKFYANRLNECILHFSVDREMHPMVKEGLCKKSPWTKFVTDRVVLDSSLHDLYSSYSDLPDESVLSSNLTRYLRRSEIFSSWVQLDTPGFVRNARQHRQFGLAVSQMVEALNLHLNLLKLGSSFQIRDSYSSKKTMDATSDCSEARTHDFSWRDFFDIAVRWRQISEPSDPVWWIDGMTLDSFQAGFGLQTPMISGQLKCIRYHSYCEKAFQLVKSLITKGYYNAIGIQEFLDRAQIIRLSEIDSIDDLYTLVGKDFYVIVPCNSLRDPSLIFEGTRLTLVRQHPDGFEFTIRTPSTPDRFRLLELEMDFCFKNLIAAVSCSSTITTREPSILRWAVVLFYYWIIFSPLSRGSAACGYAALMAAMASISGCYIDHPIPCGKQLDWEAILAINVDAFIENEFTWLSTLSPFPASTQRCTYDDNDDDLIDVQQLTLNDMFLLLQSVRTG